MLLSTTHPTFDSAAYTATIPENSAIGSSVLQIHANNPESVLRSELIYSLYPTNAAFLVNAYTGVINTNINLDYELEPKVCCLFILVVVVVVVVVSNNFIPKRTYCVNSVPLITSSINKTYPTLYKA